MGRRRHREGCPLSRRGFLAGCAAGVGALTTLGAEAARRELVLHQGKSAENVAEAKACRTKLAALVKGDMEKLLGHWDRWGWHRVTFFGDLRQPVLELAKALNLEVVEEA